MARDHLPVEGQQGLPGHTRRDQLSAPPQAGSRADAAVHGRDQCREIRGACRGRPCLRRKRAADEADHPRHRSEARTGDYRHSHHRRSSRPTAMVGDRPCVCLTETARRPGLCGPASMPNRCDNTQVKGSPAAKADLTVPIRSSLEETARPWVGGGPGGVVRRTVSDGEQRVAAVTPRLHPATCRKPATATAPRPRYPASGSSRGGQ